MDLMLQLEWFLSRLPDVISSCQVPVLIPIPINLVRYTTEIQTYRSSWHARFESLLSLRSDVWTSSRQSYRLIYEATIRLCRFSQLFFQLISRNNSSLKDSKLSCFFCSSFARSFLKLFISFCQRLSISVYIRLISSIWFHLMFDILSLSVCLIFFWCLVNLDIFKKLIIPTDFNAILSLLSNYIIPTLQYLIFRSNVNI